MEYDTLTIAFIGGPGCGKSRTAARLFADLKERGSEVELCTEFAKDLTWEQNWDALGDSMYVTGCQQRRESRLVGKVEYIVTDSPIIMGPIYFKEHNIHKEYEHLINGLYKAKNIVTIFLNRQGDYHTNGRTQTEKESREIDDKLLAYMQKYDIPYVVLDQSQVLDYVLNLNKEQ
jgi:ABC-type glutathione transport system ATPase component